MCDTCDVTALTIPGNLFAMNGNVDINYRYERNERIHEYCRKFYEKFGIEDVYQSNQLDISILFPENYDEKKLANYCLNGGFIGIAEDFTSGTIASSKKLSKTIFVKVSLHLALRALQYKFSISQYWRMFKYFFLYAKQHKFNNRQTFSSINDYTIFRRVDFGGYFTAAVLERVFDFSLTVRQYNHPLIKELNTIFLDLNWQINDLYSFRKEYLRDEHQVNAVTVLKCEKNVDWQTAIDLLVQLIKETHTKFVAVIEEIRAVIAFVPQLYLSVLTDCMYLSYFIYAKSPRYNPKF